MTYQPPKLPTKHSKMMTMDNWRSNSTVKESPAHAYTPSVPSVASGSHINASNAATTAVNTNLSASHLTHISPLDRPCTGYVPLSPPAPLPMDKDEDKPRGRSIFRNQRGRSLSPIDRYSMARDETFYRSSRDQRNARDRQLERIGKYRREDEEAEQKRKQRRAHFAARGMVTSPETPVTVEVQVLRPHEKNGLFEPVEWHAAKKLEMKVIDHSPWVDPLSENSKSFEREFRSLAPMIQTSVTSAEAMPASTSPTSPQPAPSTSTISVPEPASFQDSLAKWSPSNNTQDHNEVTSTNKVNDDDDMELYEYSHEPNQYFDESVSTHFEDGEDKAIVDEGTQCTSNDAGADNDSSQDVDTSVRLFGNQNLDNSYILTASQASNGVSDGVANSSTAPTLCVDSSPATPHTSHEESSFDSGSPQTPSASPTSPLAMGHGLEFRKKLQKTFFCGVDDEMGLYVNSSKAEIPVIEENSAAPTQPLQTESPHSDTQVAGCAEAPVEEASAEWSKSVNEGKCTSSSELEQDLSSSKNTFSDTSVAAAPASSVVPDGKSNKVASQEEQLLEETYTMSVHQQWCRSIQHLSPSECLARIRAWIKKHTPMLCQYVFDPTPLSLQLDGTLPVLPAMPWSQQVSVRELRRALLQLDGYLSFYRPDISTEDRECVQPMVQMMLTDLEPLQDEVYDKGKKIWIPQSDAVVAQRKEVLRKLDIAKHSNQARESLLRNTGLDASIFRNLNLWAHLFQLGSADTVYWYELQDVIRRISRTLTFCNVDVDMLLPRDPKILHIDTRGLGFSIPETFDDILALEQKPIKNARKVYHRKRKVFQKYALAAYEVDDITFIISDLPQTQVQAKLCSNVEKGGICPRLDCRFRHPNAPTPSKPAWGYAPEPKNLVLILADPPGGKSKPLWKYLCGFVNKPQGCISGKTCRHSHALVGILCPDNAAGRQCPRGQFCPLIHKSTTACPFLELFNTCKCTDDLQFHHPVGYFDLEQSQKLKPRPRQRTKTRNPQQQSTSFVPYAGEPTSSFQAPNCVPPVESQAAGFHYGSMAPGSQQQWSNYGQYYAQPRSGFQIPHQPPPVGYQAGQPNQWGAFPPPFPQQKLGVGAGVRRSHGVMIASGFQPPVEQAAKRQRNANKQTDPKMKRTEQEQAPQPLQNPPKKKIAPNTGRVQQQQAPQSVSKSAVAAPQASAGSNSSLLSRMTRNPVPAQQSEGHIKVQPKSVLKNQQANNSNHPSRSLEERMQRDEISVLGAADRLDNARNRDLKNRNTEIKGLFHRQLQNSNDILSGSTAQVQQKRSRDDSGTTGNGGESERNGKPPRGSKRNKNKNTHCEENPAQSDSVLNSNSRAKKRDGGPRNRGRLHK